MLHSVTQAISFGRYDRSWHGVFSKSGTWKRGRTGLRMALQSMACSTCSPCSRCVDEVDASGLRFAAKPASHQRANHGADSVYFYSVQSTMITIIIRLLNILITIAINGYLCLSYLMISTRLPHLIPRNTSSVVPDCPDTPDSPFLPDVSSSPCLCLPSYLITNKHKLGRFYDTCRLVLLCPDSEL